MRKNYESSSSDKRQYEFHESDEESNKFNTNGEAPLKSIQEEKTYVTPTLTHHGMIMNVSVAQYSDSVSVG